MGNPDAAVRIEKERFRKGVWHALEKNGIAHECQGRIPDFTGKEIAARNLAQLALWRSAEIVMVGL